MTRLAQETPAAQPVARRTALRTLGGAAVGGLAGLFALNGSADAVTGAMQYGALNNAGASGTTLTANLAGSTLSISNSSSATDATVLSASLLGSGIVINAAVDAIDGSGWAVLARCLTRYGYPLVSGGGRAQLYLMGPHDRPSTSLLDHVKGEILFDTDGSLWVCIADGTPGTWRRLAGVETAGSFHPISAIRAYDSRRVLPGPQAVLATGQSRTVWIADQRNASTGSLMEPNVVPVGATAIAYNLTIVNTVGTNGYLAVNESGNTTVSSSIINWSASGLTLANSSVAKLNEVRELTVICGGTATSCHFIIDVLGYYL